MVPSLWSIRARRHTATHRRADRHGASRGSAARSARTPRGRRGRAPGAGSRRNRTGAPGSSRRRGIASMVDPSSGYRLGKMLWRERNRSAPRQRGSPSSRPTDAKRPRARRGAVSRLWAYSTRIRATSMKNRSTRCSCRERSRWSRYPATMLALWARYHASAEGRSRNRTQHATLGSSRTAATIAAASSSAVTVILPVSFDARSRPPRHRPSCRRGSRRGAGPSGSAAGWPGGGPRLASCPGRARDRGTGATAHRRARWPALPVTSGARRSR